MIEVPLPQARPHSVFEKNVWIISFTPSKEGEQRALASPKLVAFTLQVEILIIRRLRGKNVMDFNDEFQMRYNVIYILALIHIEIQS